MEESTIKSKNNSVSTEFLLEEYRMLQSRFHSLRDEANSRLNFLLTLTSAIIGVALILSTNSSLPNWLLESALLLALILLSVISYSVFRFMITRDRVTDRVEKGMGRIRRYFVNHDPELANHLIYRYDDKPTNFVLKPARSQMRRTAQILNASMVGLALGIVCDLVGLPLWSTIAVGFLAFIIDYLWLRHILIEEFSKALQKSQSDVNFKD